MQHSLLAQEATVGIPINANTSPATLFQFGFQLFLIVVGILVFVYMLWGAVDWIISGGEKEKIHKAKMKIISAFIGIILVAVLVAVWYNLVWPMLGIFNTSGGNVNIKLPSINQPQ